MAPDELPLYGRADRVETHADGVHIIDLKTGVKAGDAIKEEHRQQLLFYAFTYFVVRGVYPKKAAVEFLGGDRRYFDVDPREAEAVAKEALDRRESYNRAIEQMTPPSQLASPSNDNCRYCDYCTACPALHSAYQADWSWFCPPFLGVVRGATSGRNGCTFELQLEAPLHLAGETVRFRDCPDTSLPPAQAQVAIVDAMPTAAAYEFRLTWGSRLHMWTRGV